MALCRGGVIFTDILPRNPQGKVMRAELRQMYKDHQPPKVQRRSIANEVRILLASGAKENAKQTIIDFIIEVLPFFFSFALCFSL
jgi:hypothetical protein